MARKWKVNRDGWEPQGKLKIEGIVVSIERRKEKTESFGEGEWKRVYRRSEGLKFILRDKRKFLEAHMIVSDGALSIYGFNSISYGHTRIPDREAKKVLGAQSLLASYKQVLLTVENSLLRSKKTWELENDKAMLMWVMQDMKKIAEFSRGLEIAMANSLNRFLPKIRK